MAMKSLEQLAKEQRALRRQAMKAHRAAMSKIHATFNAAFDAAMAAHGLSIRPPVGRSGSLMDVHSFPPEFHADVAPAKQAFLAAKRAAEADYAASARTTSVAMPKMRRQARYAPRPSQ